MIIKKSLFQVDHNNVIDVFNLTIIKLNLHLTLRTYGGAVYLRNLWSLTVIVLVLKANKLVKSSDQLNMI